MQLQDTVSETGGGGGNMCFDRAPLWKCVFYFIFGRGLLCKPGVWIVWWGWMFVLGCEQG